MNTAPIISCDSRMRRRRVLQFAETRPSVSLVHHVQFGIPVWVCCAHRRPCGQQSSAASLHREPFLAADSISIWAPFVYIHQVSLVYWQHLHLTVAVTMSSPQRTSSVESTADSNMRKRVCKACDRCRLKKSKVGTTTSPQIYYSSAHIRVSATLHRAG